MTRLIMTAFGEPVDSVELDATPTRAPGVEEVVVRMEAATINPGDFLLIRGQYPIRPELPYHHLGVEGVGRVIASGDSARDMVGNRVLVLPTYQQGAWADTVVASRDNVIEIDSDADALQLAMLPLNPITAQVMLDHFVHLEPGDWVGQTAANGAVGQWVIELAKRRGVKTLNIVRREAAAETVLRHGGDRVVVMGDDLEQRIHDALGDRKLSLALDALGGDTGMRELSSALKFGGYAVNYGSLTGGPAQLSAEALIVNEVRSTGFWFYNWLTRASRAEVESAYRSFLALLDAAALNVPVEATYRLKDFRQAFQHAETERAGKIVFVFDD
ncbi:zinc-dependent alcohol dehydrogenase family protein [Streptomyces sp. NPDC088387]|uniref:zinc-dependent alcohol dehydrogenase family protein n=1 Tax=Streptomyces sp. NPDC088387 TaxID=3365859 RepID=UPI0038151F33